MSDHDDRLAHHLRGLAATIDLRPGDPAAAVGRAARRRQRRRAGLGAALGLVAVTTTVVAVGSRPTDELQAGSPTDPLAATEFDWTVVDPDVSAVVQGATATDDGTLYGLSTAPGTISGEPSVDDFRRVLYRSVDGAEWTETALPDDLWASDVAAAGDTVYAVGTGAAGGAAGALRLAGSADGGATWDDLTLPLDLADLEASYPGEIVVSGIDIAAGPGGVVAAVTVQAMPAIEDRVPPGDVIDLDNGWSMGAGGVTVYGPVPDEPSAGGSSPPVAPPPTAVPTPVPPPVLPPVPPPPATSTTGPTATEATAPEPATSTPVHAREVVVTGDAQGAVQEPPVVATYTWEELGVEGELLDLVTPRVHLLASPDGTTFEEVTLPTDGGAVGAAVLATDDGFLAFVQRFDEATGTDSVSPFASTDGRAWEAAGADLPGYVRTVGVLGGRPAVVTDHISRESGGDGFVTTTLRVQDGSGAWSAVDLLAPVVAEGAEPSDLYVGAATIGPLGAAVAVHQYEDGGEFAAGDAALVVSTTGADLTVVPIADYLEAPFGLINAVVVTADAISATVVEAVGDGPGPGDERVLVGTPRG